MPDDRRHRAVAQSRHQPQGVADEVEHAEGRKLAVVGGVPAAGAPVAPLVRRDHVKPRLCERQHHLSPAVRELWEAVQQQDAGPVAGRNAAVEAGLQHMHAEAVDVVDEAGAYAGGQNRLVEGGNRGHLSLR